MTKAFVFGKFLPFHKGHQALINFALTHCDFLSVLVCASDQEEIPAALRKQWIEETYKNLEHFEVQVFTYSEDELPNTSVSSQEVSKAWSEIFKKQFPDYSLLITSEKYGDFVADYLKIKHLPFDPPRNQVPVSASIIRENLFDHWHFLPNPVKAYYATKVVILGTESTGKTSLVEKLGRHLICSTVSEAGRDLIPDSSAFEFEDLYRVAKQHAKQIRQAISGDSPLIIIDTDIHITQSYASFCFGKKLEVSDAVYELNKADLYLYLNKGVPHVQDGTRLAETERNLLDASHRHILQDHQIPFVEIQGNWEERFEKASKLIEELVGDLRVN